MMHPDTIVVSLDNGRELAWCEYGDPAGRPVVGLHGTPGSRLAAALFHEAAVDAGIRLVSPDRAGYGHSSLVVDRRLVDFGADIEVVVDRLGIDRFGVVGVSGGGPHALACAHWFGERLTGCCVVSGTAPNDFDGWNDGMMPVNRVLTGANARSERLGRIIQNAFVGLARRRPDQTMDQILKSAPASDRVVLERPEVREWLLADLAGSSATTGDAAAQDFALIMRPWGFDLAELTIPIDFWQGDADVNVPPSHGSRQAEAVQNGTLHECPGEGHFLLVGHAAEILAAALEAATP